ncbi:hypothetical protein LUZ60_016844 [Juncus effusus]|nr:hypothetical protein LUZ60_016844 [Juncus effusus]
MASFIAFLVVVIVAAAPVYGVDYTVGDTQGWTSGVDYTTWAKGKSFNVGDSLVFQYSSFHNVDEVGQSDYSSCSSSNSLQSYSDQNTKITLSKPGTRYFICGTTGHCSAGMKLAVTVSSGSTTTPSATPTTPATPSDTPSTTPDVSTPTTVEASPPKATTSTKSSTNINGASESGSMKAYLFGFVVVLGFALMG